MQGSHLKSCSESFVMYFSLHSSYQLCLLVSTFGLFELKGKHFDRVNTTKTICEELSGTVEKIVDNLLCVTCL